MLWLEWTLLWNRQVFGLNIGQLGQLDTQMVQVASCDGFIQDLWQDVDTNVERTSLFKFWELLSESSVVSLEQSDLSQDLVGEGTRHDEGRVASSATQVDQSSVSQ